MKWSKRLFDLFWTLPGTILLSPILLIVAILVKLSDGGPVFFRQERVGLHGQPFKIWKFRTMRVDAEKMGRAITVGRDPRITGVGHWLRKLKLDELPQLFNVLAGEMSLVGPRPEVPRYVALYTDEQRRVLELMPGITDPASIKYRNESEVLEQAPDPDKAYIEQIMPDKIAVNLDYAGQASVWADLGIVMKTFLALFE